MFYLILLFVVVIYLINKLKFRISDRPVGRNDLLYISVGITVSELTWAAKSRSNKNYLNQNLHKHNLHVHNLHKLNLRSIDFPIFF